MKKVFFTILMFLPLMASAQEVLTPEEQLKKAQQQLLEAQKAVEQAKKNAEAAAQAKAKAEEEAKKKAEQEAAKKQKELQEKQREIQEQAARLQEEAARLQAEADKLNAEAQKQNQEAENLDKKDVNNAVTLPAKEADRKPVVTEQPVNNTNNEQATGSNWTYNVVDTNDNDDSAEEKQEVKRLANGAELKDDPKYLEGAVPVDNDGDPVFERTSDANGKNAAQISAIIKKYMSKLVKNENNVASTMMDISNQKENKYILLAQMDEWIVFNSSFISLDRTECKYRLWAYIYDNKVDLKIDNIRYAYEEDRSTGFKEPAKNVITDKYALSKKKNKLARIFGKFRKGTIDRKDQIFNDIIKLIKQ